MVHVPTFLRSHRLIPRVTLVWAALAAGLLVWNPRSTALVHFASTSVHNLSDHPLRAIVLSVFTLANGWGEWATWAALSIVWIAVEVRLGWLRALVSFVSGHVLATVALAFVQTVAVASHLAGASLFSVTDDVGASYGFVALAGAGLAHAVRRDRRWLAAAPALILISVVDVTWWTILGHAMAIATGVSLDLAVSGASPRRAPVPVALAA
ncbi:MAG TPA: rhomboid-like protein [Acidimicrobiales bacterium]